MRTLMLALGAALLVGTLSLIVLDPAPLLVFTLFALAALVGSVLIGGLLRQLWAQDEQRTIDKNWQEREQLLDSRRPLAPWHQIGEWRLRSAAPHALAREEPVTRVLYLVARDQPELFDFLRRDFAAEEAEGVIEILVNRRRVAQAREADRRDPQRNRAVTMDLREIGLAFVRQQTP